MPLLITVFIAQAQHLEQARSFSLELFNKYGVKSLLLTPQQTNIPSEFVVANSLKSLEDTLTKLGYTIIFTDGQWAIDSDDGVLRVFPKGFDLAIDAAAYQVNR